MLCGFANAEMGFSQVDTDGNGKIDHEEFRSHMLDTFYRADVNRDGALSGNELNELNSKRVPTADKNGDGRIDMKEFLNATSADFRAADTNRDNVLSPDEVKRAGL